MTRPKDDHKTPDDEALAPDSGHTEDHHATDAGAARRAAEAGDEATADRWRDETDATSPLVRDDSPAMGEGAGVQHAPSAGRDLEAAAARDDVLEEDTAPTETRGDRPAPWAERDVEDAAAPEDRAASAGIAASAASRAEPEMRAVEEDEEHDEHGMGVAGRLLVALLIAIVAAIGSLYAAPKLAPHVPAGVAKYLVPGQADTASRIAELDAALTATNERIAALETSITSGEAMGGVASAVTAVEERVTALETNWEDLGARVEDLAAAPPVAGEPGAAVAGAIADLEARLDRLSNASADPEAVASVRSELTALQGSVSDLSARIEQMEEARAGEIARLEQTVRASALERAVATLAERARSGGAFADELAEVEQVSGAQAPEAVAAAAVAATPSTRELARSLSEPAQAALAADVRAEAGDGAIGQIGAWFRSQIVARPTTAREGDGVGAILSRVSAKLEAGDAPAALVEAEALPPHAQEAMSGWLDRLRARAALDSALAEWVVSLGVNG